MNLPEKQIVLFRGELYAHMEGTLWKFNQERSRMLRSPLGKLAACASEEELNDWDVICNLPNGLAVTEERLKVKENWVKEQSESSASNPPLQGQTSRTTHDVRG